MLRDLYQPTVQYAPALFDSLFHGLEHDGALRRTADAVCRWAEAAVERWARDADVVVTTYPLAGQTLGALREQGRITAPAMTYLTDPAAHATWCHPAVDHHLTVTEATARRRRAATGCAPAPTGPALRAGLRPAAALPGRRPRRAGSPPRPLRSR